MAPDIKIIDKIEKHCLLPKLSRNYDECENHAEYEIRKTKLGTHFQQLIKLLGDLELKKSSKPTVRVLSCLLIFYKELESEGPWNDKKCKEYAKKLNSQFETSYQLTFNNLLRLNIFNAQDIFDKCMHDLHKKLTADEFKKYPGLIEVYCSIVQDIKVYNIVLCPMKIMPAMLLLIDDHVIANKLKGLMCCLAILKCLSAQDFQGGNYYEVVYKSLRSTTMEKHLKVTNALVHCFLQFLRVLPNEAKIEKADNLYVLLLDEIMVESNLYRKAMFFNLSAQVIFVLQGKCVKEKIYKKIICDNLDICCDKGVAEILLPDVLVSLEEWIQNSWFVWKLSTDRHLLMMMFKVLYVCSQNNVAALCQCISTLIALSTKEEREEILRDLDKVNNIQNSEFQARLFLIKNDFNTK